MSFNHFQLIVGALEVGLEGAPTEDGEVSYEMPHIFDNLPPPVSVRAVVVIDGHPYEIYIKAAEPGEAHEPGVTHED
jgi:hypothetical protein